MTKDDYGALYTKICALENRLRSSHAQAWMKPELREELSNRVRIIRDDLYKAKRKEDLNVGKNKSCQCCGGTGIGPTNSNFAGLPCPLCSSQENPTHECLSCD